MATDKKTLTLEGALAEFPEECKAALSSVGHWKVGGWWYHGCRDAIADHLKPRRDTVTDVAWAAMRWLEGKYISAYSQYRALRDERACWPTDPLRWLLEEVREQLKREKDDGKLHCDRCGQVLDYRDGLRMLLNERVCRDCDGDH